MSEPILFLITVGGMAASMGLAVLALLEGDKGYKVPFYGLLFLVFALGANAVDGLIEQIEPEVEQTQ